jgi:uncharacterized protein (DUF983 family)
MASSGNAVGSLWDAAVRLRCPACGRGRLFRQGFDLQAACSECGQPFGMGEGDFVGGIYLNYGIVGLCCFALFFWMEGQGTYSTNQELTVLLTLAVLLPILSARHARAFFLATMYSSGSLPRRPRDAEDEAP